MITLPLSHFDLVMKIVRRKESQYSSWTMAPPSEQELSGGLFGLSAVPPRNALGAGLINRPALSPFVIAKLIQDQQETLTMVRLLSGWLEMDGVRDRIDHFKEALDSVAITYKDCFEEWKALRTQIDKELDRVQFLYVFKKHSIAVKGADERWASVFKSFPSVKEEVLRALACASVDQPTATVFHIMRVAEFGLRIIAKERKIKLPKDKPIEAAQWLEITNRLKPAIDRYNSLPAKYTYRTAALSFYEGVHADVVFLKDRYRNPVSHSLTVFEEPAAETAVRRVHDLMTVLASRLDENARQIRWSK